MRDCKELIPQEDDSREKFFAYLLRKPCTRKQAQEYLRRMKLRESLIDEADEAGLIDDEAYARLFAEGHLSWGNMKISYELSMRGVSRENIRLALDDIDDEAMRAGEIAEGWQESGLDERKIKSRLISRGFTNRAVNEALRED